MNAARNILMLGLAGDLRPEAFRRPSRPSVADNAGGGGGDSNDDGGGQDDLVGAGVLPSVRQPDQQALPA